MEFDIKSFEVIVSSPAGINDNLTPVDVVNSSQIGGS